MGITRGQTCKPLHGPTLHTHDEIPATMRAGEPAGQLLDPLVTQEAWTYPASHDMASTTYPKQLFRTREGMRSTIPHPP